MKSETIVAIATASGVGAIGIVRMSGPDSGIFLEKVAGINAKLVPRNRLKLVEILDPDNGKPVDRCLISFMPAPHSYTGEDTLEINCHGSPVILESMLELLIRQGARLARPGEFTKRAFLNNKLDLLQAEAVMDLIAAKTQEGARVALGQMSGRVSKAILKLRVDLLYILSEMEALIDFPDDMAGIGGGYLPQVQCILEAVNKLIEASKEGQLYRNGVSVAIVGVPNVGKSSLLNCLLGHDRAIVSPLPGTTRDTIEEACVIAGIAFRFVDTAGIRDDADIIEQAGIARTEQKIDEAELVLFVKDASLGITLEEQEILSSLEAKKKAFIVVANKIDLVNNIKEVELALIHGFKLSSEQIVTISASQEYGIENMKKMLLNIVDVKKGSLSEPHDVCISNLRHVEKLLQAQQSLIRVVETAERLYPLDLWSIDLRDAITALGEITGDDIAEEIIDNIFSQFCIGK